jgi:hypothetical protein
VKRQPTLLLPFVCLTDLFYFYLLLSLLANTRFLVTAAGALSLPRDFSGRRLSPLPLDSLPFIRWQLKQAG